jgi:glycosyltransferase involved in cell wall biosynthesis
MNRIKILYIIDKMKPAGAQTHLAEVVSGLDKALFESRLVTLEELGVKRIYGLSGFRGLLRLIRLIKKERFDIVQTYLFSENILGVIAAKLAGVKIIITGRRDTGLLCQGGWQHILAYRLTNPLVSKIICVSEAVRRVVLKKERVEQDKVEVIFNGVNVAAFGRKSQVISHTSQVKDLKQEIGIKAEDGRENKASIVHGPRSTERKFNEFSELRVGREDGRTKDEGRENIKRRMGFEPTDLIVGMVANFSWIKGHEVLLKAAPEIIKAIPNVKFILIGEGPLLEGFKVTMSQSHTLKEKIIFLGKREDISELLSIMDVSLNLSYSEGMSNTILESMASGVPVVATAIDGNLETVTNETGVLVSVKDEKATAEAIIKLLKDQDERRGLGENASRIAREKFDSKIMIKKMEELYKTLINDKLQTAGCKLQAKDRGRKRESHPV